MDQGALESLVQTLPNDLAEYVSEDNRAFDAERIRWDVEQEEKKKQESMAKMDAESSGGDTAGELMVCLKMGIESSEQHLLFRFLSPSRS